MKGTDLAVMPLEVEEETIVWKWSMKSQKIEVAVAHIQTPSKLRVGARR